MEVKVYRVKPENSKKENLYVIIAIILILLLSFGILSIRRKPHFEKIILHNEINAYEKFNNLELGIYNEILNALEDIEYLKSDEYPSIKQLEEENIYPFVRYIFDDEEGHWYFFKHDDSSIYYVEPNLKKNIGGFIVEIQNSSKETTIYYIENSILYNNIEIEYEHLRQHLKKIIAHTGSDERMKIKGE